MKGALLALLVVGAVTAGIFFYWESNTTAVKVRVEKNLKDAQKRLSDAGEGITLTWKGVEAHPFPLGKGVRILSPALTRKGYGAQSLSIAYLDVEPRKEDISRIQVTGPLNVAVSDSHYGNFALSLQKFPSVMLRTPVEERTLPENSRSFMGDIRITPPEVLEKLPDDVMHQYSVVLPAKFSMTVEIGGRRVATDPLPTPATQLRNWQAIDYRLASDLEMLFTYLNNAAHSR